MTGAAGMFPAEVTQVQTVAHDVLGLGLRRCDGADFPLVTAGAHVTLALPSGLQRQYSVVNGPGPTQELFITVQLQQDGRGGSKEVFAMTAGTRLSVSAPVSTFALVEADESHLLIAGGIGITPIWSMVQHAEDQGRPWELHYGARSEECAAFVPQLRELERRRPGRVHFAFSDEGQRLDLDAVVASAGPGTGLYCCGPERITQALLECATRRGRRAHLEDFTVAEAAEGGFPVTLARTGTTVHVPEGGTVLEAVLEAGVEVEYSCMSGTCGTCRSVVLSGEPDHQDYFLSDEEKEAGDTMLICCSGCRRGPLVLDL